MGLFALAINEPFNYPYYFSMFPAGPDAVHEFSRGFFEIAKEQKLATVAIVGADSDFAKKAADGAHDNATKMGFKIVYDRSYPPITVDFSPVLRGDPGHQSGFRLCRLLSDRTRRHHARRP